MDIRVVDHPTGSCRVVTVTGQLDMSTAPQLERALIDEAEHPRLVVDLAGLTFCDSIGLSTLVVAQRSCQDRNGFLRLARPSPFVLNLLTVVGVRRAVEIYDSVDAAAAISRPMHSGAADA
jgi:anti-sigma B factor antagonist